MRIGILSDTHNEIGRTTHAVKLLLEQRVELLVHCGDLSIPEIVDVCSVLPFYFVFGNHDSDMAGHLKRQSDLYENTTCLEWGGEIEIAGKRIAVAHGHLTMDLAPLLAKHPDYILSGHFHDQRDWMDGKTRRINPGALFRAEVYSVAVLNLLTDELEFFQVPAEKQSE